MTDLEFYELRTAVAPRPFFGGFAPVSRRAFEHHHHGDRHAGGDQDLVGHAGAGLAMTTVIVACTITAIFSMMGGLTSVLWVDAFMFVVAMVGSIGAAVVSLNHPSVGGMSGLLAHSNVQTHLAMLPSFDFHDPANRTAMMNVFLIPLLVQWWAPGIRAPSRGGAAMWPSGCLPRKTTPCHRRSALLQRGPLRLATLALDHCRAGLTRRFSRHRSAVQREFPYVPAHFVKEIWPTRRCSRFCRSD